MKFSARRLLILIASSSVVIIPSTLSTIRPAIFRHGLEEPTHQRSQSSQTSPVYVLCSSTQLVTCTFTVGLHRIESTYYKRMEVAMPSHCSSTPSAIVSSLTAIIPSTVRFCMLIESSKDHSIPMILRWQQWQARIAPVVCLTCCIHPKDYSSPLTSIYSWPITTIIEFSCFDQDK